MIHLDCFGNTGVFCPHGPSGKSISGGIIDILNQLKAKNWHTVQSATFRRTFAFIFAKKRLIHFTL